MDQLLRSLSGLALLVIVSQGSQADKSALDRHISDLRVSNPTGLHACAIGMVIDQIARAARVPVGFENAPGCAPSPRSTTTQDARRAEAAPREETLHEITVREAFDHVLKGTGLTWAETRGVVLVRPESAWRDNADPLNRRVGAFSVESARLSDLIDRLLSAAEPSMFVEHHNVPKPEPLNGLLSFSYDGGTVVDALNDVVRMHPDLEWQFSYAGKGTGMLVVNSFEISGGEVLAPVAISRER